MRIYNCRTNSAKFHPDLIWNDGILGFYIGSLQEEEEAEEDGGSGGGGDDDDDDK